MVHKIGRLLRSPVKFHQPKYVQNHKNRFGSGSNCLSQITGWKTQSRGEKTREFILEVTMCFRAHCLERDTSVPFLPRH